MSNYRNVEDDPWVLVWIAAACFIGLPLGAVAGIWLGRFTVAVISLLT